MAYVFAEYANQIWPQVTYRDLIGPIHLAYAGGAIVILTVVNLLGVREGKWTQNVLTTAKVLGLAAIVAVGFTHTAPSTAAIAPTKPMDFGLSEFGLAMIFVLFTYGGWNEMAYVAAEVKEPRKNILRVLLVGTLAVTAIYVIVNLAFIHALGLEGTRNANVAADVLRLGIGPLAGQAISLLICISALGAINGQIFTGSRIYYAMGQEHRLYAWLGRWNARRGTPVCSLLIQGAITLALAIWFGLTRNGFERMVIFTTPAFWFFLMLVAVSVFVLRWRDAAVERPYRVPGYPVTPILFCLSSAFMVYSSVRFAIEHHSWEAVWSIAILLVGVVMSFYESCRMDFPVRPGAENAQDAEERQRTD
jgi:amino acid transporter